MFVMYAQTHRVCAAQPPAIALCDGWQGVCIEHAWAWVAVGAIFTVPSQLCMPHIPPLVVTVYGVVINPEQWICKASIP